MVRYRVLSLIPKNLQSYLVGKLSRIKWPLGLAPKINGALAKYLNIDLSDSKKSLEQFHSFEDLFTRELKEKAREIEGPICSPCDSILRHLLPIKQGQMIQAKGLNYSVEDLLSLSEVEKESFNLSWYGSFYLAPHNYHRVHTPFSGSMLSARYIPGQLWPVNDAFVNIVPRLFCRNERVVFELEYEGGGRAYLVMVGALHVGRIQIKGVDTFVSNSLDRQLNTNMARTFSFSPPRELQIGDELGTFMLGSTVILVFDDKLAGLFNFSKITQAVKIALGESLLKVSNE